MSCGELRPTGPARHSAFSSGMSAAVPRSPRREGSLTPAIPRTGTSGGSTSTVQRRHRYDSSRRHGRITARKTHRRQEDRILFDTVREPGNLGVQPGRHERRAGDVPRRSARGTPRWSPDGERIAFDSSLSGQWGVYVVTAGGGRPVALTNAPSFNAIPSWSHDGKWIYFCSDRGGTRNIWRMPAQGGEAVQVTHTGALAALESANGKFVVPHEKRRRDGRPVEGGCRRRRGNPGSSTRSFSESGLRGGG